MKAFEDTTITKAELITELKAHQVADNFVRGVYFEDGKGCAVGCSLESASRIKGLVVNESDHRLYEDLFGLPEYFALLSDKLFEGMSLEKSKSFPLEVIEAVNIGSNLREVEVLFKIEVLKLNLKTLEKLDNEYGLTDVTNQLIAALKSQDENELSAARAAARAAAESTESAVWAAESAVWAAAWAARAAAWSTVWAAESAARAAAWSAESTAWSAESTAWAAAYSATYDELADIFIKLVKESK